MGTGRAQHLPPARALKCRLPECRIGDPVLATAVREPGLLAQNIPGRGDVTDWSALLLKPQGQGHLP